MLGVCWINSVVEELLIALHTKPGDLLGSTICHRVGRHSAMSSRPCPRLFIFLSSRLPRLVFFPPSPPGFPFPSLSTVTINKPTRTSTSCTNCNRKAVCGMCIVCGPFGWLSCVSVSRSVCSNGRCRRLEDVKPWAENDMKSVG